MTYANPDALVSTEWLAAHLNAPDVRIVDATWLMPHLERDARAEYESCHIPGAVYFDIDDIADSDSDLPHMLPSPEKFSSRVRKLGLGDGNRIVVYSAGGGYSAAARVWWMFRLFGHEDVAVLDGGLTKWLAEERPVEDIPPVTRDRHLTARVNHFLVRDVEHLIKNVETGKEQVIDVRSPGRFAGTEPEPRPSRKKGHIPGSVNLPFMSILDKDNHLTFKSAEEISAALDAAGVDTSKPMVTSCGSGVTAAVVTLGLFLLGHEDVAVYDGSWSEWGDHYETPVVGP
jgi:thiosulfate/3-mercaptopyruvate sulfurtransferase